ncbi:hypothetical protein CPLU01_03290 [Colletotrichum plurivorum]|uniref:Geranylgeranyl pyrophosphate synthetase n=1 Tax=Colletotrichum plurivorum TaxID=2175906 RepID=A0A8H6KTT7_9PEZI|nr:hypothetical protein CPLU01_03290 [Colletotrichum plurivorum]
MADTNHPDPREAWMWRNVPDAALRQINSTSLSPSDALVSSTSGSELVCSYNWKNCDGAEIHIPGHAPIWQDIPLPITLQKDEGTYFIDQNASRVPEFPFEPLFRATASMNPSFRFEDVDVLVNRNSLRKLLDFSARRHQDSFRINLHLVGRTLVVERCERSARELIRGSQNTGFGRRFEAAFTKHPAGLEDSAAHHRALKYQLGNLTCVVRFEVDACYRQDDDDTDVMTSSMELLSMGNSAGGGAKGGKGKGAAAKEVEATDTGGPSLATAPMAQSLAAEIKTAKVGKSKSVGSFMPQLWFGRTPWLISGRHTGGCFTEVKFTDTGSQFGDWEDRQQTNLRKLVTVLDQLRGAVEANGGGHCVAICEKATAPPVIRVFPSTVDRKAVPDDLRRRLWNPTSSS